MKEAIITGANGFVGRHLVRELCEKGYTVYAVVRSEAFDSIALKNVNIIKCDMDHIKDLEDRISSVGDDCVFYNLAWEGNSGALRGDYELQLLNVKRTIDAAVVAKKIGCRKFIMAGSVTQLLYRDYLRCDNITPEIVTLYSIGKMSAEAMLKCVCCDIDLNLCCTYIANFYGEDDTTQNFINFLIDNYSAKKTPVLTPAEQLADFIHVDDVAKALRYLGEKGKSNNSYYIGYGDPKPLKDFIKIIHEYLAPEIPTGIGGKPFSGESIDYTKIDYKKINRETGFVPQVRFEDGIKAVIEERLKLYV